MVGYIDKDCRYRRVRVPPSATRYGQSDGNVAKGYLGQRHPVQELLKAVVDPSYGILDLAVRLQVTRLVVGAITGRLATQSETKRAFYRIYQVRQTDVLNRLGHTIPAL